MNRGNALRKRGDLGETMAALRGALAEGERSHNLWAVASAHTGLGVVAMQLNDFTAAAAHLNRAVARPRDECPQVPAADRSRRRRLYGGPAADDRGPGFLPGHGRDVGSIRGASDARHHRHARAGLVGGRARARRRRGATREARGPKLGRGPGVRPGAARTPDRSGASWPPSTLPSISPATMRVCVWPRPTPVVSTSGRRSGRPRRPGTSSTAGARR